MNELKQPLLEQEKQLADQSDQSGTSNKVASEQSEDAYCRPQRSFESSCCVFGKQGSESQIMTFEETLQKLFNLCHPDTKKASKLFFFDTITLGQFLEILCQLKNYAKDQKFKQFDDIIDKFIEDQRNPIKFLQRYESSIPELQVKSDQWSHGSKNLEYEWTHQQIWLFFRILKEYRLISTEQLVHFLYFREVTYDTFLLFDQDNDGYLRAISVDHKE